MLRVSVSFSTDIEDLWMGWFLYLSWLLVLTCSIRTSLVAFHYVHCNFSLGSHRIRPETKIWLQVVWEVIPRSTGRGVGNQNKEKKKPIQGVLTRRWRLWTAGVQSHWGTRRWCRTRFRVVLTVRSWGIYLSTKSCVTLFKAPLQTVSSSQHSVLCPGIAQHSENEDHGIRSHHFMGNRWGNSGNSVGLYFSGVQNHYRWWMQPWN